MASIRLGAEKCGCSGVLSMSVSTYGYLAETGGDRCYLKLTGLVRNRHKME